MFVKLWGVTGLDASDKLHMYGRVHDLFSMLEEALEREDVESRTHMPTLAPTVLPLGCVGRYQSKKKKKVLLYWEHKHACSFSMHIFMYSVKYK